MATKSVTFTFGERQFSLGDAANAKLSLFGFQSSPPVSAKVESPFLKPGRCVFECEGVLKVDSFLYYVCKEHLSKISPFFRNLFAGKQEQKEFEIKDEKADDLLRFLEATDPDPEINEIKDAAVSDLMRLADKFDTKPLKVRLAHYISTNMGSRDGNTALKWFLWALVYNMPDGVLHSCLPAVACLPLSTLRAYQPKIGQVWYPAILDAKLSAVYARVQNDEKLTQTTRTGTAVVFKCAQCSKESIMGAETEDCVCNRKLYKDLMTV